MPEPYNFNFDFKDDTGNGQYRRESGDTAGVVRGSYGYTDAYGLYRIVDYVADKDGFRGETGFGRIVKKFLIFEIFNPQLKSGPMSLV